MPTVDGNEAIILEYLPGGSLSTLLHANALGSALSLHSLVREGLVERPAIELELSASSSSAPPQTIQLSTSGAARLAREMASGLAFLHAKSYIHRDIKATNILLDVSWHAKVHELLIAPPSFAC